MRVVLTIAGSDSGAGAGIQADLKTFAATGVYGVCAITSVTAQNTLGVRGAWDLPPEAVWAQLDSLFADFEIAAAKTGMLANAAIVRTVAEFLRARTVPHLVVDPVMRAKSGDALLAPEAQRAVVEDLFPLASIVTPNVPEAEALLGERIVSLEEMREAAVRLADLGCRAVLLKGGHMAGEAADILYYQGRLHEFEGPRLPVKNTHGTGCTLSAAIAAELAKGLGMVDACRRAKEYLTAALAQGLPVGHGIGPFDHFVWGAGKYFEEEKAQREGPEPV